jgi:hypothetical protein
MSRLDDEIDRILTEGERQLAERLGPEPGFLSQMKANFTGPGAWVFTLTYAANIAFFALFLFAGFRLLTTESILYAVQWATGCLSALVLTVYFKTSLAQRTETARILRELRLLHAALIERNDT